MAVSYSLNKKIFCVVAAAIAAAMLAPIVLAAETVTIGITTEDVNITAKFYDENDEEQVMELERTDNETNENYVWNRYQTAGIETRYTDVKMSVLYNFYLNVPVSVSGNVPVNFAIMAEHGRGESIVDEIQIDEIYVYFKDGTYITSSNYTVTYTNSKVYLGITNIPTAQVVMNDVDYSKVQAIEFVISGDYTGGTLSSSSSCTPILYTGLESFSFSYSVPDFQDNVLEVINQINQTLTALNNNTITEIYYLEQIRNEANNYYTQITVQTVNDKEILQQITNKYDEIEEQIEAYKEALEELKNNRTDENINLGKDHILPEYNENSVSFLTSIMSYDIVQNLMLMVIGVATLGFILYGER